ncbi:polyhydroxyalkanoate granule-associated phasin [uncultured Azohydromonas sp.]|jgi:hypothetical protein|uniref:polyhydroxyalkanoate granule-associated phasin n=1 Tax=uncultured Azohydromonas sp. TaxID=487342 RepID=UPI002610B3E7|nr:polyhydroxyalkanoate granule-associated phasin [uncultured Azohydromonas sp.]
MPHSIATWSSWWRNAQTMWEIAQSAPQVIAHRSTRMALAGHMPSARDRKEFHLMGAEKLEAMGESAFAVMLQLLQAQQTATLALMSAWWKPQAWVDPGPWLRAMPGVTAAGLKPVHKRVTANAQRLARVGLTPAAAAIVPTLAAAVPAKRAKAVVTPRRRRRSA